MFRKLALAAVALASIAASVPASAHGFGGGHFGGGGGGFHGGFHGGGHFHGGGVVFVRTGYVTPYSCYRIVYTAYGPRRVNVCY